MGTLAVTGSVWLPSGARLRASGTTTVQPKMLIGSDSKPPSLTRYPGLRYARMFNSGALASLAGVPAQVLPHVSFESNNQPINAATVNAWLTAWGGRPGYITIDHEVNSTKKASPALYRANNRALAAILAAHPNGHYWKIVEIYGLYQQIHVAQAEDYTLLLDDATADLVHASSWDAYVEQQLTAMPDVPTWSAPVLAFVAKTRQVRPHKSWMVSECGWLHKADPTGTKGGPWLCAWADLAEANGCEAFAPWDNPAGSTDYVLTGAAFTAWAGRVNHQ